MVQNKYIFRKNVDIGALDAETDPFLSKAFVDKLELSSIQDFTNNKSIIIGRTGSGKSALIKHLEDTEENVIRINPETMSLKYLSNSDILDYFKKLNVNLDLFYKVLWKHVFIVELLKMYFGDKQVKEQNFWANFKERFQLNKRQQRAIAYLRNWENEFWERTEHRIKEIVEKVKTEFSSNIGVSIDELKALMKSEKIEEAIKKYDVVTKAQSIVNEAQIEEIIEIIEIMKNEMFSTRQKKYYILIDDLDKEWVDVKIVYELIKNLIVVTSELRKLQDVKIIIALRNNLFDIAFGRNESRGIQREKYNSMYINLEWSSDELLELVNKRLEVLMKEQYTNASPKVDDIFPEKQKNKISGFDYLLERTFMRPRDVIDFFNKCISKGDGQVKFTRTTIKDAEKDYSLGRFYAICDEWRENFGEIETISKFLFNVHQGFTISDLTEDQLVETLTYCATLPVNSELFIAQSTYMNTCDLEDFAKPLLRILCKIGLLGIKKGPTDSLEYSYQNRKIIEKSDITNSSRFYIHKAFNSYFRLADI